MSNLATVLVEAAERSPGEPAVEAGGTVLTYAQLDEISTRVAGGLLAHGVRPDDRVGLHVPDGPAFPALFFGVLRIGAVVLPARPRRARLVFVPPHAPHAPHARPSRARSPYGPMAVPAGPDFLDQVALWPRHPHVTHREDDDPAVVLDPTPTPEAPAARNASVRLLHPSGLTLTHGDLRADAALTERTAGTAGHVVAG